MYSEVFSTTLIGLDAVVVNVEIDAGMGIPYFEMSGYLTAQVKEAKERVKVAIRNSGFELKPQRVVVNISPADIRKAGTGFDLPIALGILAANGIVDDKSLKGMVIIGELSLDGGVNSVRGVLASVDAAKQEGFNLCIVPAENLSEGSLVKGIEVKGVNSLSELAAYINDGIEPACDVRSLKRGECASAAGILEHERYSGVRYDVSDNCIDFSDVRGQTAAKRATLVAAAGMHNIMYIGPPGSGKTMLAQRIPTIMPKLTFEESMQLTKIYSVAGKLEKAGELIKNRPFRSPHYSITQSAFLGGGRVPEPGEVTLASKGVLFLDELTCFQEKMLESLRQPIEDKVIRIVRMSGEYVFPSDFMLVAAMNPCKCGYYPDRQRCSCSEYEVKKYLGKISRPMWDRFDISVAVDKLRFSDMQQEQSDKEYSSENMSKKITAARELQLERFEKSSIKFNSFMTPQQIHKFCRLGSKEKKFMESVYNALLLTARGYNKILKTARTIADLEGKERISVHHLSEAVSYRSYVGK